MSRRWMDPESAADIGKLDPEAIARYEAGPGRSSERGRVARCVVLAERSYSRGRSQREAAWPALVHDLITQRRVARNELLVAAERIPLLKAVFPHAVFRPTSPCRASARKVGARRSDARIVAAAWKGSVRPTPSAIATALGVDVADVDAALLALEAEGSAMRGNFEPDNGIPVQWCDRRLLARVHRYTVKRLQAEIEPVRRAISCASCSTGSDDPCNPHAGPMQYLPCSDNSKASMRPRRVGNRSAPARIAE